MKLSELPALAPFRIRSYRFQWPADLATSWAFEMETLILGWYVLVETRSVFLFTLFASLAYIGTLLAPLVGVVGDRIGQRNLMSAMRAFYATCAAALLMFSFLGVLTPVHVFVIATLMGTVRPSDMGMRAALVGDTMPNDQLMGAMSIQRTTSDSAKIAGALTGAGLVATLGMTAAYVVVVSLYTLSFLLTRQVTPRARGSAGESAVASATPWRDLREGAAYVWTTRLLFAAMCFAFLINLTAFPLFNGLLPYVAKEIYHTDQTGLGYLVACGASGALLGSIVLSRFGSLVPPARGMLVCGAAWYAMLLVFSHIEHPGTGMLVLFFAGIAHSMGQVPMAALLLRNSDEQFRGRVMGIRMLMIYGMPLGLLIAGPLIGSIGYSATATLYCLVGLGVTLLIILRWRSQLWRLDAPANRR